MSRSLFIFLAFCLFGTAIKAQSADQLTAELTNKTSRIWRLQQYGRFTFFLGDTCTSGIQYNFILKNNSALKKECVNNHWQATKLTWAIAYKAPDFLLKFSNGEQYQIQFIIREKKTILRLRKFNPSATMDTFDLYFEPIAI